MLTLRLRADLEFALHLGSKTRFNIEDVKLGSTTIVGISSRFRKQDETEVLKSAFLRNLSSDLQSLFMDITDLVQLLNDAGAGHRPKINCYTFHETLILLGYQIVDLSPLGGPRPKNRLENAVHLGLTAFILTFMRGLDHKIIDAPLLYNAARIAAQESFDDEENQEVLLWLLFIGGASIFTQLDDIWLIVKTKAIMQTLGLHTWRDVSQTLAKFPWVSAVHDNACHWERLNFSKTPTGEIR